MRTAALSANVNKFALLRNARGQDHPNLLDSVDRVLAAGAHGVTVHPRRDQRHIRFDDVPEVADHLAARHPGVELNVECEVHPYLLDLVLEVRPAQCTLVPVRPGEVTSDHGWDLPRQHRTLAPAIDRLRAAGIRTSIFMDAGTGDMKAAAALGIDRVELYTGPFAWAWGTGEQPSRTAELHEAAAAAVRWGLEVNAGHDLDRHNLAALRELPGLREVSIGHALVVRALEVGTAASVGELLAALGAAHDPAVLS